MAVDSPMDPKFIRPKRRGINFEKIGWLFMRGSGILLIVLIFGHLFINLLADGSGIHVIDFSFVSGKLAAPFWQWWDVLMLWLALIHGSNGMRTIINDYVVNRGLNLTLKTILVVIAAVLILLGTLVVFTFDPCPAGTDPNLLADFCKDL